MAPNLPEYAVVFHGVATAGGTVTTLNPTYTADEIRLQLNDSKATVMITVSAVLPVAQAAIEGTSVKEIYSSIRPRGRRRSASCSATRSTRCRSTSTTTSS